MNANQSTVNIGELIARFGGISALALPAGRFDVLIDEAAQSLAAVHVSAGARGIDVELAVADLVRLTGARFTKATKEGT